jgi:hypothetical protein
LDVIREVTKDNNFSTFKMADLNYKMNETDKKAIKERIKEKNGVLKTKRPGSASAK